MHFPVGSCPLRSIGQSIEYGASVGVQQLRDEGTKDKVGVVARGRSAQATAEALCCSAPRAEHAPQVRAQGLERENEGVAFGGTDKNLDWFYAVSPRLSRYSMGLREPSEILIRCSLYQRI